MSNMPFRGFALRCFPFDVMYLKDEGDTAVVAVAHQRRSPLYWMNRLQGEPDTRACNRARDPDGIQALADMQPGFAGTAVIGRT
jgi:hypothetical protein